MAAPVGNAGGRDVMELAGEGGRTLARFVVVTPPRGSDEFTTAEGCWGWW